MKLFRNRIVLGVICIVLSLIICFAVTPLFNKAISNKTEIVRVAREIRSGDEITSDMLQTVEVGAYNLPENVIRNVDDVTGKYATADFQPGDYILSSKVEREPSAENEYLYHLNGEKQAISVSPKSFAAGLSGKLQSGDIVSVIEMCIRDRSNKRCQNGSRQPKYQSCCRRQLDVSASDAVI